MDPKQGNQHLLTIREFCAIYRIDDGTIRKRIRKGQMQAFRQPGCKKLFVLDPGWEIVTPETTTKGKNFDKHSVYLFRGSEVARFLGITPRSVRRMALEGRLGFARIGDGLRNRKYSVNDLRKGLATIKKGSFQEKRPSSGKVREAVMKWGYEQLGIEPPTVN